MNILFLSLYEIKDSDSGYIYADLIREFAGHGHSVYAVSPTKEKAETFIDGNGVHIIRVKNGQIQKTGKIKKLINLLMLEKNTIKTVEKYVKDIKFDLIVNMCSNLCYAKTSEYFKKRDNAVNYLLLKDIFPQNAVDMDMMKTSGIIGLVYKHFRNKEKRMYKRADFIGCMSRANKKYILDHDPEVGDKLTVLPNSICPQDVSITKVERDELRAKYGLPPDKTVFVYGGNLGKPQSIPFVIDCLRTQTDNEGVFFLILGDGTDYAKFEDFLKEEPQSNIKLLKRLPREEFDRMLSACDVGMLFLDHRFTVPNYPSRLLSYMQAGIPVFACTDPNTDVSTDIEEGGLGWCCNSGDASDFVEVIKKIENSDLEQMGINARSYLLNNFTVEKSYQIIMGDYSKARA